jgi:hypothetical protein
MSVFAYLLESIHLWLSTLEDNFPENWQSQHQKKKYPDLSRNVCATWWNTMIFKKEKKMMIGNVTFWNCLIIWYFGPNNRGSQNSIKEVQILLRTNWLKFKLKLIAAYQIVYLYQRHHTHVACTSQQTRTIIIIFLNQS